MKTKGNMNAIEKTIFRNLSVGVDYEKIACDLHISIEEIERHVSNVFCKLETQAGPSVIEKFQNRSWLN